jgi:predicted transcriptional regulator
MKNPRPRGNMEITKEILNILKEGETVPTRIQHRVNVSYIILSRYLSSLKYKGLIKEIESDSSNSTRFHYSLTEEGENYLKILEEMNKIVTYFS